MSGPKDPAWLKFLQDPEQVWRFQSYFGIRKVGVETASDDCNMWLAKECSPTKRDDTQGVCHDDKEEKRIEIRQDSKLSGSEDSDSPRNILYYQINNRYWHTVFRFSAQLGHELFFIIYFVFTIINLDSNVARKIVFSFNIVMYTAQALKDFLAIDRPRMPPVVQLEPEYSQEYGMPSTHAMNTLCIVSSTIFFTKDVYSYPVDLAVGVAGMWCFMVCLSRLYLGMHSWADILAGLATSAVAINIIVPAVNLIDLTLVTSWWAPLTTAAASLAAVLAFPRADRWTPSWGDSSQVVGTNLGIQNAFWLLNQMGKMEHSQLSGQPPFAVGLPTFSTVYLWTVRFVIVGLVIAVLKLIFKPVFYFVGVRLFRCNWPHNRMHKLKTKSAQKIEVIYQFLLFFGVGFLGVLSSSLLCKWLGFDNPYIHVLK